ncbi:MAG TPA: nucleotide sugar dehydrogenase, partial [bacterium]|nr:nucleotide sugar dehydrogenase [bacterium]
ISSCLRPGQLVSLESTTYPGTTREIFLARFQSTGLVVGHDYYLVYSPEREDPGNPEHSVQNIPKLVGGITTSCTRAGVCLYGSAIKTVLPVSSPEIAESSKLLENIYRAVNIALVNELKLLFSRMGINIWEVIAAARTKPFGFQAFYPGPGLGGHCLPIDPFYLTWKARQYDFHTSFIELAGEINSSMPYYVVEKTLYGLNMMGKAMRNARILLVGLAYKKDVDDIRESPAFKIWKILREHGARVDYFDPYVPRVLRTRQFDRPVFSIKFSCRNLRRYDAAIIVTNHTCVDYHFLRRQVPLVIDTRNVFDRRYRNVILA